MLQCILSINLDEFNTLLSNSKHNYVNDMCVASHGAVLSCTCICNILDCILSFIVLEGYHTHYRSNRKPCNLSIMAFYYFYSFNPGLWPGLKLGSTSARYLSDIWIVTGIQFKQCHKSAPFDKKHCNKLNGISPDETCI